MADLVIRGDKELARRLLELAERMPQRARQEVRAEAELVATDSAENYVPVDLGTLRSSKSVESLPVQEIGAAISFGGPAAPYALAVHEHPSSHSPPTWQGKTIRFSPAGRGPKYLEIPLRKALPEMAARIAAHLEKDLK